MNKPIIPVMSLLVGAGMFALATACHDGVSTQKVFLPEKPDYTSTEMWYTCLNDKDGTGADVFYVVSTWEIDWTNDNGDISHWADVWNSEHRAHMDIEIQRVSEYMAQGNNFYSPYYRHTTIEAWATQNEDTIYNRTRPAMQDVIEAFDHFNSQRDRSRPLVLAGFSQGGLATVELLKHMDEATARNLVAAYVMGYKVTPKDTLTCKNIRPALGADDTGVTICYNTVKDVKYIAPVVSVPCAMCINPVNWSTDSVAATLSDTITVTLSPKYNVLVVTGYDATEYKPILDFLNVGDIHGCEPWLYSECLRDNIRLRTKAFLRGSN